MSHKSLKLNVDCGGYVDGDGDGDGDDDINIEKTTVYRRTDRQTINRHSKDNFFGFRDDKKTYTSISVKLLK